MGAIIMRNCDLRESNVPVNLPSRIQQVRVSIQSVMTTIQGLSDQIRRVVSQMSLIHSYPLHCSHLDPLFLSFLCTTLPSWQHMKLSHPSLSLHIIIMSWHWLQHTQSTAHNKYGIHRVWHTLTIESTKHTFSSLHSHNHTLISKCSFGFWHTYLDDWPHSNQLTMRAPMEHYCLQVLVQTCSITPSKCISKLIQLLPPTSLDRGLPENLQTHTITASECISKDAQ